MDPEQQQAPQESGQPQPQAQQQQSDQEPQNSSQAQQQEQPQSQHQDQPQAGTTAPGLDTAMHPMGPDSMGTNDMSQYGNGFMDPSAMAAMMQGQAFMPDPNMGMGMGGMQVPDAQLMMPLMLSNGHAAMPQQPNGISSDDIALYDRQIRLWGVAAQARIQNANILLITAKALANEVAKNLVLAGVGSLTILDDSLVTESDLGSQFFLSEAGDIGDIVGQNRAQAAAPAIQKLNPRVQVHVDPSGIKSKGPSYFSVFDVVIATDLDPGSFNLINTATRLNGKSFYAASTHGMYGFIFSDLIEHDFVIERDVGNVATKVKQETRTRSIIDVSTRKEGTKNLESVTKRELYSTWFLASDVGSLPADYTTSRRRLRSVSPALSCLRALWEFMQLQDGRVPGNRDDLKMFTQIATQKHKALSLPSETLTPEFLRSFLQNLGSEIAPVTAILGGQLAQDVINVLSQKEQPIQNMVILDGTSMEALMYPLHPEGMLGAGLLSMTNDPMAAGNGGAPQTGGDMMMGGTGMGGMGFDTTMGGMQPHDGMNMGGGGGGGGMPLDQSAMGGANGAMPTNAPQSAEPFTPKQQNSAEQQQQQQGELSKPDEEEKTQPAEAEVSK